MIGAAYYDEQRGTGVQRCTDSGCGQNVGWIANGDHLGFADVDFGAASAARVTTRFASGAAAGGSLEYRLDSPTGPVVATQAITPTGGWQTWASATTAVTGATGKHRLHVVARGGSGDFTNLNWFQFSR
ncbi:carbohydrate-binding protein [Allokutzneria sp. A3M-2-11 16]|uniref:carbohydrate-binding protein n=1 Tax=Allokutzneria sp. A3M-2-11 16 TaxID=2962043 RepID=UPI0020B6AD52|nr:carbohydrate-binding protein [Allokutzneria sp. A3M-2-11 16]MCP3801531.1 carbohydrate-binding protein [Allokutzneria sp. A3M-2-11 16]